MPDGIKSGKEVIDEFILELANLDGVDKEIVVEMVN